jgi:hypothetical protein
VDDINAQTPGESELFNLVAAVARDDRANIGARRTFKIGRGAPLGASYARDVAARFGVSFEQLTGVLRERRLLP